MGMAIQIKGTINRICSKCGEDKKCYVFEIFGREVMACSDCIFIRMVMT